MAAFYQAVQTGEPPAPLRHVALQVPARFGQLTLVDERFVDVAHRQGLAVHVWTIEEESEMDASSVELGVDGIITDRPTALVGVLDELGADMASRGLTVRSGRGAGPRPDATGSGGRAPGPPWDRGNDVSGRGWARASPVGDRRDHRGGRQPRPQFGFLPWLAFFLARSLRLLVRFDTVRRW